MKLSFKKGFTMSYEDFVKTYSPYTKISDPKKREEYLKKEYEKYFGKVETADKSKEESKKDESGKSNKGAKRD